MILAKDLNFRQSSYIVKLTEEANTCYDCGIVNRALKGNPKKLLKQLKINPQSCTCSPSAEIEVFKKRNGKCGTKVGRIRVIKQYDTKAWETHSGLSDFTYKGKGFGLYLYSLAADWCASKGYKLQSSTSPSDEAQRVWNSKRIRKYYSVRKEGYRWTIKPKVATKLYWEAK